MPIRLLVGVAQNCVREIKVYSGEQEIVITSAKVGNEDWLRGMLVSDVRAEVVECKTPGPRKLPLV